MGTAIRIEVRSDDADFEAAFAVLREADAVFSTYRTDSEISRLGRGELLVSDCSPEVAEVLERCAALRERTRGYFSVRAGGTLDPSGYVKGWAAGRALAALGAADAYLEAGGDIVTRGRWRVGIRHPLERDAVAAVLDVEDLAVATSGAYERGAHVLDPHTARPPEGLLSVTIVGPDPALADAYATAVFAMGRAGPEFAAGLAGYEAFIVLDDETVLTTPGLPRAD
jgi:thiamine biosynthesis lipoprotein